MKILGIIILLLCLFPEYARADQDPVLCVIGEAENQGYRGMLAVSEALRNRGTQKGVYGCKAKRIIEHKYSDKTYRIAQQAWIDSAGPDDITQGSTNWENVKAFGKPYWADSMEKTVLIGDHQFYKEKK